MREVPHQIAARLFAAASVVAERGLEHTKIEDIAAATGVPKATLYYYFSSKEDIFAFLLGDALNRIADEVAIALESAGNAAERLQRVVVAQLVVMGEQPSMSQALMREFGRAGRIPELAQAVREAYYLPVTGLLVEGAEDGSLRSLPDPFVGAMILFGAVTITGLTYVLTGAELPADVTARSVLTVLMDGLRPPPADSAGGDGLPDAPGGRRA